MHRVVIGLILNVHLVRLHVSSPKFLSPVTSQTEMLGYSSTVNGDGSHEREGEGGTDHNGLLCSRHGVESIEPLLLLIQATQVNGHPVLPLWGVGHSYKQCPSQGASIGGP